MTPWVDFVVGYLFDSPRGSGEPISSLDPFQREMVLVGVLTAVTKGQGVFLAIHFYWGLMQGMSVKQVADTSLLAGTYSGINVANSAMATLIQTLSVLKQFRQPYTPPAPLPTPEAVTAALLAAFKGS
jgi:hypothetical protein